MRNLFFIFIFLSTLGIMSSCILTEPNKPSNITGKVTNSAGVGLADVTVQVDSTTDNTSVKTADDGSYQLNLPTGRVCKLVFGKTGYTIQNQVVAVRSGQIQTMNVILKTLTEDAYFRVNLTDPNVTFPNYVGNLSFSIATNVLYDFECSADWISCVKSTNTFSFSVSGNDTFSERNATITLKPQYGKSYSIYVKQQAGPFLALLDYTGKDAVTNFLTTIPFITFNRPVSLKSATSTEALVDLTPSYSIDRKTIYFPNIKITPFSFVTVNYTVQSDENMVITSGFDLKMAVNSQYVSAYKTMLFSKDNQYLWVQTDAELIQYNTTNFALSRRIALPNGFGSTSLMFYNPYSNSLYLIQHTNANSGNYDDVRIYNAATGNASGQLKLEDGGKLVSSLAFNNNGYGIMVFGGNLYYFDSANNHAFGVFSQQSWLYDPVQSTKLLVSSIRTCNGFKTLVLDGASSAGTKYVFTVDADTKTISQVYTGTETTVTSANFSSGFFLFSPTVNQLSYFDISSNKVTTQPTNNPVKFLGAVISDSEIPKALTNDLTLISLKSGTINKYTLNVTNGIIDIKPSNDGKFIAVYYSAKIYLLSSDVFGLYSSKLK